MLWLWGGALLFWMLLQKSCPSTQSFALKLHIPRLCSRGSLNLGDLIAARESVHAREWRAIDSVFRPRSNRNAVICSFRIILAIYVV